MNNFFKGIEYLFAGFELIFKPGLRRFVVIPLIINILIFSGLFFLFQHFVHEFNLWIAHYLPTWLAWLSTLIWLLFVISFLLIFLYLFVTLANLVAAPFNSFLAEKVEFYLTGKIAESRSLRQNIQDIPRIMRRQLAILGYYIPRALLVLILFFIPIVHFVVAFIWYAFNAWFMTLTYIDYPTDNHRVPFSGVQGWLKKRRTTSFGFGLSVLVVTMVPILNFFVIPAAVAGATKFWVECQ